jgi:hypothetical protein
MTRSSFAAALSFIAVGAVLAFAVHSSATAFNVNLAGFIVLLAGVADLAVRFMIGSSPLLSPETAEIAAVLEPVGEPVLDAFGRPVTYNPAVHSPAVYSPAAGIPEPTMLMPLAETRAAVPAATPAPETPSAIRLREDQVLRVPGDYSVSGDVLPVSPFTGRRTRPARRRRR